MTHLLAFLSVSVLVIVTPGQDTALTIRNTLLGGRRAGTFTGLGVSAGQAIWALAAGAGVAALLSASEPAFVAVKLAGAAYLVLLGLQALRRAFAAEVPEVTEPQERRLGPRAGFRQGLISNLGNPKMALFFTSLLPQFATSFASLVLLGVVFSAMTLAWLTAYAAVVARARVLLRRSRVRRTLDGLTGAALIGLGVRLAGEHR